MHFKLWTNACLELDPLEDYARLSLPVFEEKCRSDEQCNGQTEVLLGSFRSKPDSQWLAIDKNLTRYGTG